MIKLRKIFSLIVNLIAVAASIVGFIILRTSLQIIDFAKFFTLVTNLSIVVVGLISVGYAVDGLIKKDKDNVLPEFVFVLKLITAVGSLITFITVVAYLQHTVYKGMEFTNPLVLNNICHHYVGPLAFICGLIFFDLDKKYSFKLTFFGIIVLVIYMCYAIPFSNLDLAWWGEPPYVFMSIKNVGNWMFLLLPGFLIGGYVASFLIWLLNRICYLIFIGEEITEKEETPEEKKLEKTVKVTEADKEEVNDIIKTGYKGPRIYHISKRSSDRMWQVKFANGKKAIKLFYTQAEAIVFAKQLAKSQDGSIRVHSVKGKIRKEK